MIRQVIGYKRVSGTAKESGKPFEIIRLVIIEPIQARETEKLSVVAAGGEGVEIPVSKNIEASLLSMKYPSNCVLETEAEMVFGQLRAVVTKVTPQPK